ncbi:metallopeptidase TldD-related protein [Kaarinaea lacus]
MSAQNPEGYFRELSEKILALVRGTEVLLTTLEGEQSDFVRLNQNRVRQVGNVQQLSLYLDLNDNHKQSSAQFSLCGHLDTDLERAAALLNQQRELLPYLPDDPFISYATEPRNTHFIAANKLPDATEVINEVITNAAGLDLVGIWASGEIIHGFANSFGQFNWHQTSNFNFDWSVYLQSDKAIKQNYAGVEWDSNCFTQKIDHARQTFGMLAQTPKTIDPGQYRVFLAPSAVNELMDLLRWDAFSLKSHRTLQTSLLKLSKQETKLHDEICIRENNTKGLTPLFTSKGYIKPEQVLLIENGEYRSCLANSRSAKEYYVPSNCNVEQPQSLEIHGGALRQDEIFSSLDTGVFISNLWYCNYSDRNNCRITGMTRFACLWVENGTPVAPLNVMRFDESLYRLFGEKLVGLTDERERIFDSSCYQRRSEASALLPGALIDDFTFTL